MPAISFPPYAGTSRKLVLAIDVGTTFSGVSYAILDPGVAPQIYNVNRFPGQTVADYKVPSVLLYNEDGTLYAAGAEAAEDCTLSSEEREKLTLVEWFKLHLHLATPVGQEEFGFTLKALPEGKTVIDVLADFLHYLFNCTRTQVIDHHPNGKGLWETVENDIDIILSHPNGWDGLQHAKLREAAVKAGLVSDKVPERIQFITEGEASINYCVSLGLAKDVIKDDTPVIVIDAGGGTIDISSYRFSGTTPLVLKETTPAACLLQGSSLINMRFEKVLLNKLGTSKFNNPMDVTTMLKAFEAVVKPRFKDCNEKYYLRFGAHNAEDKKVSIKNGQFHIQGSDLARLFEPVISAITEVVKTQQGASEQPTVSVGFLVGGFAASPWLYEQLLDSLGKLWVDLCRPDTHTNKAVAEGAVVDYLSRLVVARVARLTIGTVCGVDFDENDSEHAKRKEQCRTRPSGVLTVPGKFVPLVLRGTSLAEDYVVFRSMCREHRAPQPDGKATASVMVYRGDKENPEWVDEEPDKFETMCTIVADTSNIESSARSGKDGDYFVQLFDVVLGCGKTEWNAYLRWKHEDMEKLGTAKIAYREDPSGR